MSWFDKIKALLGAKAPVEEVRAGEATVDAPGSEPDLAPDAEERVVGVKVARRTSPKEDAEVEAAARGLFEANDPGCAIALLSERAILFARHDPKTSLPCLCKSCLRPELGATERDGIGYVRDFIVTKHRALFYWMRSELASDVKQSAPRCEGSSGIA